jgi:ABC-type multidrug transport system ATPase subunit
MLFSGDQPLKKVKVLSGGEKMRCMFSRLMLSEANTLIVDQPTNHLDLEAIQSVNTGLKEYKGSMLLSSHDHSLLSSVSNKVIVIGELGSYTFDGEFDNYLTKPGSTNNFGELLGCYIALNIALKEGKKNIYGDSKLIIEYWSKGRIKAENLSTDTVELAKKVVKLRKEFEKSGGNIAHVSGDINPSDLGFHR